MGDIATGRSVAKLSGHTASVESVGFSLKQNFVYLSKSCFGLFVSLPILPLISVTSNFFDLKVIRVAWMEH